MRAIDNEGLGTFIFFVILFLIFFIIEEIRKYRVSLTRKKVRFFINSIKYLCLNWLSERIARRARRAHYIICSEGRGLRREIRTGSPAVAKTNNRS